MKNLIRVLILLIFAYNTANAQAGKGFELEGNIEGLKDGSNIYLLLSGESGTDTVLTVKSKNSKFTLKGYVKGEANYYFLKLDSGVSKDYSNALWLINSKLNLSGNIKELGKLTMTGSDAHEEYTDLTNLQEGKTDSARYEVIKEFIKVHYNSLYISDLILKAQPLLKISGIVDAYYNLTPRAKNSYWGLELEKRVRQIKNSSFRESKKLPDFNSTTVSGDTVSILNLISKSKYTLLDFWASWCHPCRAAIPKMEDVYKSFKDKGFNIIGISTDKSKERWIKAIAEDKTNWTHIRDNLDSASKQIFDLAAIPGYILVDNKGNIIRQDFVSANNLNGNSHIQRTDKLTLDKNLFEIISGLIIKGPGR